MRDIIPLMNKLESIDFLSWLKNRIQYRYQEKEQDILSRIQNFINRLKETTEKSTDISEDLIDKIAIEIYSGYEYCREDDDELVFDIGYTNEQKKEIKKIIKQTINSYIKIKEKE